MGSLRNCSWVCVCPTGPQALWIPLCSQAPPPALWDPEQQEPPAPPHGTGWSKTCQSESGVQGESEGQDHGDVSSVSGNGGPAEWDIASVRWCSKVPSVCLRVPSKHPSATPHHSRRCLEQTAGAHVESLHPKAVDKNANGQFSHCQHYSYTYTTVQTFGSVRLKEKNTFIQRNCINQKWQLRLL